MFIRFDVIHERDRRTDGRTLHDSIDRACIASRCKMKLHYVVQRIDIFGVLCTIQCHNF